MSHRLLPTVLAIAVAVLYGAVPLRECHATDGGGVVVAGEHAHDGGGCDGTSADAEAHGCACAHGHAPDGVETPSDARSHGTRSPGDEHAPCCVDGAASIFVTGVAVALPPASVVPLRDAVLAATPADAAERVAPDADPDPGDGPPDGVVAVVLLR